MVLQPGADLGGGVGADAFSPSGIRPPADPKGPPFGTFYEIHFLPTDPKIFLKAPLAPIYTNFEGERAPKKRDFLVKIFQKVPKNAFFGLFFQIFACGAKNFAKTGTKPCIRESSKNQFGRPKKKVDKIFEIFWKSALEKILHPPLATA